MNLFGGGASGGDVANCCCDDGARIRPSVTMATIGGGGSSPLRVRTTTAMKIGLSIF